MSVREKSGEYYPDPAGIFSCAFSLWSECHTEAARDATINLSDAFNGVDELMRVVMRAGSLFEDWSCRHVDFEAIPAVWPYLLEERFGSSCLRVLQLSGLSSFSEEDCLRVALIMGLRIRPDSGLPVPIDVHAPNPLGYPAFRAFRIQSLRYSELDNEVVPFAAGDDPYDPNFGLPFFGIYGETAGGLVEHITDRPSYKEAVNILKKLAPGIWFPEFP